MAGKKKVLEFNFAVSALPAKDVVRVIVPEPDLRGWLAVFVGVLLDDDCCPVVVGDDDWFDLTCYLAARLASVMVRK